MLHGTFQSLLSLEAHQWFEPSEPEDPRERHVARALAGLPASQREVIVLKIWQRLTFGVTALGSLALTLWTARDIPGVMRGRGAAPDWIVAATGTTWVASLPGAWHSVRNPAPTRLDWTNGGAFFSSMGSFAGSSTNQLR